MWDRDLETIDRRALRALQSERLRAALQAAWRAPHYRRRLESENLSLDSITSVDRIQALPFTTKQDLRDSYPDGLVAAPKADLVRLHASSGTTGKSTVIFYTARDIEAWAGLVARCLAATGATREDVFQNMMGYGLFTGGLGLHYGAERLGCLVIPASSGNTLRQIQLMEDFGATLIHITPSYALHLGEEIAAHGRDPRNLPVRKAFLGAEPYSEATRDKIERLWGLDAYNSYGLSEMNGPGVAFECVEKNGMHLWEDFYLAEIIDPDSGQPLPDGDLGELVLTHLNREAMPMLRYRTRDLTRFIPGPCPCGRTHRRIERIRGRTDDMLIVGGVNVFPSQIETVLMANPEVGNNYQIVLERVENLDRMHIRVEMNPGVLRGSHENLERLRVKMAREIQSLIVVHPHLDLLDPGSLPPSQGKAVRVIDNRIL